MALHHRQISEHAHRQVEQQINDNISYGGAANVLRPGIDQQQNRVALGVRGIVFPRKQRAVDDQNYRDEENAIQVMAVVRGHPEGRAARSTRRERA